MKTDRNNGKDATIEKQVWNAACTMRGKIPTEQYKDIILNLIFLRYANVRFENTYQKLKKLEWRDKKVYTNNPENYYADNSIYLNDESKWSTIANTSEEKIGKAIDRAMINLEACNKSLTNAVMYNFRSEEIDKRVLKKVITVLSKIDLSDVETDSDIIGRIYEFCLKEFAINGNGEYYTPKSIVQLLVAVVQPFEGCTLYEPCAGSGGMIVQSFKYLRSHGGENMKIYAQEAVPSTWKIAKQNMTIRNISADFGEMPADTFHKDLHKGVYADCIMANPPFNQSAWGYDSLKFDPRWEYGAPNDGNANYAWIEHMLSHLNVNGRMGIVLSNGTGSSTNISDSKIRKNIIEADLLESIITLPRNMFYSTTIPATLWFFSKNKPAKKRVLFLDAKRFGERETKKLHKFSEKDIQEIVNYIEMFRKGHQINISGIVKSVTLDDIRTNHYDLTPGLYIEERAESTSSEDLRIRITENYLQLNRLLEESKQYEQDIQKIMKSFME